MEGLWPYLGNLHTFLPAPWVGVTLILVSMLCGMLVGFEREVRRKPAGLKTVALICIGSTIFTMASLLVGGEAGGDPGRIAAQVVTGIGFLGAGAIMRERGTIIGLTTGATIWTVAAVGVIVGAGYAAAGLVLSMIIVGLLLGVRIVEKRYADPCRFVRARVVYRPESGKTRLNILRVLDRYHVPDSAWRLGPAEGDYEAMEIRYCHFHREHRAFLPRLANVPGIVEIEMPPAPRQDEPPREDE